RQDGVVRALRPFGKTHRGPPLPPICRVPHREVESGRGSLGPALTWTIRRRAVEYTPERGRQAEAALGFLVLGLALAGFAGYNLEWFREILSGPAAVSTDELSQAKSLNSLPSR